MNNKFKIILIISIPLFFVLIWLFFLVSFLSKDDSSVNADINKKQSELNDSSSKKNLSTGGNSSQTDPSSKEKNSKQIQSEFKKIYIHIPEYFYNLGFSKLKKELQKEKIIVRYIKYKDLSVYYKNLEKNLEKNSKIDIFLIPNNWVNYFKEYVSKMEFEQNISSLFHSIFYYELNADDYTFLPFSIDPLVTLVSDDRKFEGDVTISNLKKNLLVNDKNEGSKSKFNIPILFGLDRVSGILLKNGKDIYPGYFSIFYSIVNQSWLSQNYSLLDFFVEDSNGVYNFWNTRDFLKLKKFLTQKNKNCETYPSVCITSYGLTYFKFGFLSDINKMELYFDGFPKSSKNFKIFEFLNSSNLYPVRGRGFLVNNKSENLKASSKFLSSYLKEGKDGNLNFWKNTISAFNKVLSKQKMNKKYNRVFEYEGDFAFLDLTEEKRLKFLSDTKILSVIEGNYSVRAFLEKLSWGF